MKKPLSLLSLTLLATTMSAFSESGPGWISYPGGTGPGAGKHVVLLAGDEEYRSEEALPMLAKILSTRHGFKCTVLFSADPDGTINPNLGTSLENPLTLGSADAIIMALRFRKWPDGTMKLFDEAIQRGVPVVGLRTSTHAFQLPGNSEFKNYNDFGKNVLGERWVSHWGKHKVEATRGVIESEAKENPLLRGVEDVFGDSDVYEAYPPDDAVILMRGEVLKGMAPSDPPAAYEKKRASDGQTQDVNTPMMPVVWSREVQNRTGKTNKILCSTLGAATDLASEDLRRLVVNGVYWGLGMEVPAKADVALVGDFKPTDYSFNGFQKGMKASDHALPE
jgi:type 1 glutamine amidotransferase